MLGGMSSHSVTIGILDDEPQMRTALTRLLRSHGLEVVTFTRGEDLLAAVFSRSPWLDCLMLDLHMPGLTGFDVLAALDAAKSTLPVIVFTGHDEPRTASRVTKLGAINYLLKPLDESALLAAIGQATDGVAH